MSALQLAAIGAVAFLTLCAAAGRLSFLRSEFATTRRRVAAAGLLVAILTAVVFYPVTGGHMAAAVETDELWFPALFLGHGLLILFLLGWSGLGSTPVAAAFAEMLHHLGADIRLGVVVGVRGWMLTITITLAAALIASPFGVAPPAPDDVPPVMIWLAGLPLGHKLLVIGAAMTVEEAFFRGFLQARFGLVLSSLLFTLAHANYGLPFMLIGVLTISLVIGRAYQRTGRLLPCIVAHGIFDSVQLLVVVPWAVRMLRAA